MSADSLVDALAELRRRDGGSARRRPIVEADLRWRIQVRLGVLIDDGDARRVLLRSGDLVSGILLASDSGSIHPRAAWVEDGERAALAAQGLSEVALALGVGGNARRVRVGIADELVLQACKEEGS